MTQLGRRVRKRRSSRSIRRQRIRRAILVTALLVVVGAVAFRVAPNAAYLLTSSRSHGSEWQANPNLDLAALAATASIPSASVQPRIVYPYSLVPGGIQSADDLREVSEHDPVVGAHFAGFDYRNARIVELTEPEVVYLSYRANGHVFWTKNPVRLRKGEKLITDGNITARTRCANQVSKSAQEAISPGEPPAEKFEEPMVFGGGAMQAPFPAMPYSSEIPGLASATPPFGFPIPGGFPPPTSTCIPPPPGKPNPCPPHKPPHHKPPPAVPEPASVVLVSSGLAALYLGRRRKARQ